MASAKDVKKEKEPTEEDWRVLRQFFPNHFWDYLRSVGLPTSTAMKDLTLAQLRGYQEYRGNMLLPSDPDLNVILRKHEPRPEIKIKFPPPSRLKPR
jgi:hypothetical protein